MREYHKIQTVFKREQEKPNRILEGEYSDPAFEFLRQNRWMFTEKVDGTNIRVMWDGTNVVFGGKTDNAQIPAFLLQRLVKKIRKNSAYFKLWKRYQTLEFGLRQLLMEVDLISSNKTEVKVYQHGKGKGKSYSVGMYRWERISPNIGGKSCAGMSR